MQPVNPSLLRTDSKSVDKELDSLAASLGALCIKERVVFSEYARYPQAGDIKETIRDWRGRIFAVKTDIDYMLYRLKEIASMIPYVREGQEDAIENLLKKYQEHLVFVRFSHQRCTELLTIFESKNFRIALEFYKEVATSCITIETEKDLEKHVGAALKQYNKQKEEVKNLDWSVCCAVLTIYKKVFFLLKVAAKKIVQIKTAPGMLTSEKPLLNHRQCIEALSDIHQKLGIKVPSNSNIHSTSNAVCADVLFSFDHSNYVGIISRLFGRYDSKTVSFVQTNIAACAHQIMVFEREVASVIQRLSQGIFQGHSFEADVRQVDRFEEWLEAGFAQLEHIVTINELMPKVVDYISALKMVLHPIRQHLALGNLLVSESFFQLLQLQSACGQAMKEQGSFLNAEAIFKAFQAFACFSVDEKPIVHLAQDTMAIFLHPLRKRAEKVVLFSRDESTVFMHVLSRKPLAQFYRPEACKDSLPESVVAYIIKCVISSAFLTKTGDLKLDLFIRIIRTHPLYRGLYEKSMSQEFFASVMSVYDTSIQKLPLPDEQLDAACDFIFGVQESLVTKTDPRSFVACWQSYYDFSGVHIQEALDIVKKIVFDLLEAAAKFRGFTVPKTTQYKLETECLANAEELRACFVRALCSALDARDAQEKLDANMYVLKIVESAGFEKIIAGYESMLLPLIFENTTNKLFLGQCSLISEAELTLYFEKGPAEVFFRTKTVPFDDPRIHFALFTVVKDIDQFNSALSVEEQSKTQRSTKKMVEAMGKEGFLRWYHIMCAKP